MVNGNDGNDTFTITGSTGTRVHSVKSIHAQMWDKLAKFEDDPATACRPACV